MDDVAVAKLGDAENEAIWDRFAEAFRFAPDMHQFPGIREPAPSVTWSVQAVHDDPGYRVSDVLDALVIDALIACTPPGGTLFFLEWQHTGYRFRPDKPLSDVFLPKSPRARPTAPHSPIPLGDYPILLADDFSYGTFGHPWERSLCVFGAPLLDRASDDLHRLLPVVLRRDGRPVQP
jgi:hypothetical protein